VIAELPEGPLHGAYVGGGGFTLPRYFAEVRPGTTALVFEIDGELVELVEDELGLVLTDDLQVRVGDARLALPDQVAGSFDFVVGDAFGGLSVPWHLTTREFLREIDRVLTDDGVYVINLIDYPPLGFAHAEAATFLDVFEYVGVASTFERLNGDQGGNFVLIGSQSPIDFPSIGARILERGGFDAVLSGADAEAFAGDARVLRDDFAPVDQLLGSPPR
jgi:spermidine synthase